MEISNWRLENIKPYARNARRIPAQAVDKVAASIREFGWRQPIVVDREGVIICGHTRLLAAQKLGLPEAPVHVAENLTPAQVRAYRLLDNRSHEETDWDESLLSFELLDLKDLGIDLELTGFNFDEIDRFLTYAESDAVGLIEDDDIPELRPAVSRVGDLWVAGDHRILCGDATIEASFDRLLASTLADLIVADPPYNVCYRGGASQKATRNQILNDDLGEAFGPFIRNACRQMLRVARGALYICISSSEMDTLKQEFVGAGGHWSTFVIWAKDQFTLGRSDYHRQYEVILYGWKQGSEHYWCGARDQGDVWSIAKPHRNDLHPTMKPVALIERAIHNSSRRGDVVLDPFAGSGTTMIACEKTSRKGRLMELDPQYVDCAVRRWQLWTGKAAVLDGDGRSFDQMAAERLKQAA
jgi:DNA modification methylase